MEDITCEQIFFKFKTTIWVSLQNEITAILRRDKCDGRERDLKTINKYLELVEHLYDEAIKKQNDEAKTVQRKQNTSNKNTANGQLNNVNIRDTGGAQPPAANGGKPPEKKTLKPYRELTDGEKEKIRAFQKRATFPMFLLMTWTLIAIQIHPPPIMICRS